MIGILYHPTFKAIDEIIEQSEKIQELYKKLLAAEKEKLGYLEKLLDKIILFLTDAFKF